MSDCHSQNSHSEHGDSCHPKGKVDWLFWICFSLVALFYFGQLLVFDKLIPGSSFAHYGHAIFELMNKMWWGVVLGIAFVGLLSKVPREFVIQALGATPGLKGILRATLAGLLLDLCSHGILLVGMKLYERGARLEQVLAFLIASPWNSLSLTIILVSLIGIWWTLVFIFGSALIAIVTGLVVHRLVKRGTLPENPNTISLPANFHFVSEMKKGLRDTQFNAGFFKDVISHGFSESRMILRWLLLGVLLASAIQTFMDTEILTTYFGPSLIGLGLTLVATTIIEVCSEGSSPIAAELVNRAGAPGNGFVFMMAGVSTDYTEIMALKETTKSWKIAFFLPLITIPQVLILGYILNQF